MHTKLTLTANKSLIGDASFPSYFNGAEQPFVLTKPPQNSFSIPLGRNKPEYGEIDVFSAERYFNEPLGEEQELSLKIMNKKDDESLKQKIRPRTPSIRSESSWNSRSLLLNIPTPQEQKRGNSSCRKSFLASLACRCSCNGDNAIDVSNSSSQDESRKGSKSGYINQFARDDSGIWLNEDKGEIGRKRSVHVGNNPLSIEREVKMLAWDAIPPKCPNEMYNDADSESSSDLFEIESFSTNYTNPYLVRQESDATSGCITPTTCYAPSEASVQWSTITASMADFSIMSDTEELEVVPPRTRGSRKVREERNTQTSKLIANRLPGILGGCKSHKAVRVAGEAYRTTERQQRLQNIKPMRRFQTESKLTGHNTTNNHRFNTLPHSEAHFKHAPHMLYTH